MGRNEKSRTTLFVGGFSPYLRAKEVAQYFEKYGDLVRCDIPTPGGRSKGYAFVEFEDERDAEDAYEGMRHKKIDGREITIEWAKHSPSEGWNSQNSEGIDRGVSSGRGGYNQRKSYRERSRSRSRSRSPRRLDSYSSKRRSSPSHRRRSRSPRRTSPEKRRDESPARKDEDKSPKASNSPTKSPSRD